MAKVNQVTNETEYFAMLERIKDCSILIANPVTSAAKKAEYMTAYDDMCLKVQTYYNKERDRHTRMVRIYPGLKEVYRQIGYEIDEDEPKPEPIPEQKASYADWLED